MGFRTAGNATWMAVVALVGLSGCGGLSSDELERGVSSLSALGAQGQLIANGVARNESKATYVRVMSMTLGEEAQHEAEKLADAQSDQGTTEQRHRAVRIASELSSRFSELQTFPGDETRARATRAQMKRVTDEADALVNELRRVP